MKNNEYKDAFKDNDNHIYKAKAAFFVLYVCLEIIFIILAIVCFVNENGSGFLVIVGCVYLILGTFFIVLCHIFSNFLLSIAVDVKITRNKAYNIEDDDITWFWGKVDQNEDTTLIEDYSALIVLNNALKEGAITQEEYDIQKQRILDSTKQPPTE
jgi:hypothetical protein